MLIMDMTVETLIDLLSPYKDKRIEAMVVGTRYKTGQEPKKYVCFRDEDDHVRYLFEDGEVESWHDPT